MAGGRVLHVAFESDDEFRREYASNIANGGIFVPTNVEFDVREAVCVEITLAHNGFQVELDGEIVHVFGPEMAGAGVDPGVAVQLLTKAADIREIFEPHLGPEGADDEREAKAGHRASRRVEANLDAWLSPRGGQPIEGNTRDISRRGILFRSEAVPIPVGERVGIALRHAASGREIALEGRVVRHVQWLDEDSVFGVGVAFDTRTSDPEQLAEFVDEVRVAEHRRRMGGIGGPIAELGLASLIQMFGTCSQQGTLLVFRGDEEGFIVFSGSMLTATRIGDVVGQKALARMLTWTEGSFEFHSNAVDDDGTGQDPLPLDAALLNAMRIIDEGQRLDPDSLPHDGVLEVVHSELAAAAELGKAEAAVVDLAQVGMKIGKILDIVPEPDTEVKVAMLGMIDRGILRLVRS